MKLLIIRHADAGDSDEWASSGKPDSERPLSPKGKKQFRRAAETIVGLVPKIDLVASSPYTRARETADLFLEHLPTTTRREELDSLVPDAEPEECTRWLRHQVGREVIAVVGHEPHLSALATWLIAGLDESRLKLRKGGACLISFEQPPGKKLGTLEWLVGPKQL
jgi:phosphohistidine phosphatase